jgi:hydrogenase-4 component E
MQGISSEFIPAVLMISNLLMLGSGRLRSCIRLVALQGICLGIIPLMIESGEFMLRAWGLAVASVVLKGIIFPMVLLRILRDTGTRKEVEPFVGFTQSLAIGVVLVVFSMWVSSYISLPDAARHSSMMLEAGLATMLIGLFLIVSRRKAINQVIGYIVMENGIYAFGAVLVGNIPLLVELGVLLDAFVAVFIMGIAAYQINREFDHSDVDQLNTLKG